VIVPDAGNDCLLRIKGDITVPSERMIEIGSTLILVCC